MLKKSPSVSTFSRKIYLLFIILFYCFHHICIIVYISIHFSSYGWATTYLQLWGKTSRWRRCWPCISEIWQKRISFFIFVFLNTNYISKHPETWYENKMLQNKFQVAFMMSRSIYRSIFYELHIFFFSKPSMNKENNLTTSKKPLNLDKN